MLKEAVSAGFYQPHRGLYPRMNAATIKRAARQHRTHGEQTGLF